MVIITGYLTGLIALLQDKFGERLSYVGLQGSYMRGEETESSDIDIMVVIENLSVSDLNDYRVVIQSLPFFEKSCGFICSRADLAKWNSLEISHLLHTTKDYFGTLSELLPSYTKADIRNFIKLSVNNLYHAICHHYVHAENNQDMENLSACYKNAFFILQNRYYLKSGCFIVTKAELLTLLDRKDHDVLKRAIELSQNISHDFSESLALLFSWCQETMQEI